MKIYCVCMYINEVLEVVVVVVVVVVVLVGCYYQQAGMNGISS